MLRAENNHSHPERRRGVIMAGSVQVWASCPPCPTFWRALDLTECFFCVTHRKQPQSPRAQLRRLMRARSRGVVRASSLQFFPTPGLFRMSGLGLTIVKHHAPPSPSLTLREGAGGVGSKALCYLCTDPPMLQLRASFDSVPPTTSAGLCSG
jgi:hypothetical protein